ncbi:hypothetical protein T440DRAFT_301482 [Plenodomus tracheiphilus IPT5]|uniref:Homeobox domain-containing protein n=1 Tax=Plenodomus tracheiphilus IPT5 TaxID=1408161 RepID=A0A6A7ARJ6_9PLEO|nr:hypothetical protein T440DRAFT_301482 [Plenodomus tracheiphilus IPT5]
MEINQARAVVHLEDAATLHAETEGWLDPDLSSFALWSTEFTANFSTSPDTDLMGILPADVRVDDCLSSDLDYIVYNEGEHSQSYDNYDSVETQDDVENTCESWWFNQCVTFDPTESSKQPMIADTMLTRNGHCSKRIVPGSIDSTEDRRVKRLKTGQRTRITPRVKARLEAYFGSNPYPSKADLTLLAERLNLPFQATRTWFNNARSRKDPSLFQSHIVPPTMEDITVEPYVGTGSSSLDYDTVEGLSRTPSRTSLERYLAAPLAEEAITANALSTFIEPTIHAHLQMKEALLSGFSNVPLVTKHPYETQSVVGSECSVGSSSSMRSCASFVSVDARGPRRGRKRWVRGQNMLPPDPKPAREETPSLKNLDCATDGNTQLERHVQEYRGLLKLPVTGLEKAWPSQHSQEQSMGPDTMLPGPAPQRYFCTWQGCEQTFHHRFDWSRHEQAVHYAQYSWVCCLDFSNFQQLFSCYYSDKFCGASHFHLKSSDFVTCASRDEEARAFFRKDQLNQHIRSAHVRNPPKSVLRDLAQCWRKDNPNFDRSTLVCGFCGQYTDTWEQRQEHVGDHMKNGVLQSSWGSSFYETLFESDTTAADDSG